jgi:hypothetical protein
LTSYAELERDLLRHLANGIVWHVAQPLVEQMDPPPIARAAATEHPIHQGPIVGGQRAVFEEGAERGREPEGTKDQFLIKGLQAPAKLFEIRAVPIGRDGRPRQLDCLPERQRQELQARADPHDGQSVPQAGGTQRDDRRNARIGEQVVELCAEVRRVCGRDLIETIEEEQERPRDGPPVTLRDGQSGVKLVRRLPA